MRVHFLFVIALTVFSQTCFVQAYKCTDAKGKITYSDVPCPSDSEPNRVRVIDNVINGAEARAVIATGREREMLRAEEWQQNRASKQSHQVPPARSPGCRDAMRSYEIEAGSIRKDQDAIAAIDLRISN